MTNYQTRFLNMKSNNYGVETVDEICSSEYSNWNDYKAALRNLLKDTRMAGMDVYVSQRCTKEWANR